MGSAFSTFTLQIVQNWLLDVENGWYYLSYLIYLLWGHLHLVFRSFYSNSSNLDLHVIVSDSLQMSYLCQSGQASHLFYLSHMEVLTTMTLMHILVSCMIDQWVFLLLPVDLLCFYFTLKLLGGLKSVRDKLTKYISQC